LSDHARQNFIGMDEDDWYLLGVGNKMNESTKRRGLLFARSPLLEDFISHFGMKPDKSFRDVVVVCVQHLLETTGTLIQALLRLGFQPQNIFVAGKIYSTNVEVKSRIRKLGVFVQSSGIPEYWGYYEDQLRNDVAQMWNVAARHITGNQIRTVIILDDGGCALSSIPDEIISGCLVTGVEQTMSGITLQTAGRVNIPVVEVAASAAKRFIEPYLIQKALFQRLAKSLRDDRGNRRYGIVGYGNIGRAVSDTLRSFNKEVAVFDTSAEAITTSRSRSITVTKDLRELVERSHVLFGCSGQDVFLNEDWWTGLEGERNFISCSSLDMEFRSLLRSAGQIPRPRSGAILRNVVLNGEMTIWRGGFPMNFDQSAESVPLEEIQLTRALLLAGVLQAASLASVDRKGFSDVPLLSHWQQYIVRRWLSLNSERREWYLPDILRIFDSHEMIEKNSRLGDQLTVPAAFP